MVVESPAVFPAMDSSKNSAVAAAVAAATLMGTLGFFVRESACSAPLCAFVRFAVGLLLLFPLLLRGCMGGRDFRFSGMAAVSGAGISLCILFYFMALKLIPVGVAAMLVYAGPVLAAAAEAVWNRRLPCVRDAVPMLLSLFGLLAVACFAEESDHSHELNPVGLLYSVLSAVCYSVYLLLNCRIPQGVTLGRRTFWQFVAGCIILALPLMSGGELWQGLRGGWPYLLTIGVCHGLLVMVLIAFAARRLSAIQYGTFAYLEPTVAVLLGYLVYAEQMTPGQWCGFALVVAAACSQALLAHS